MKTRPKAGKRLLPTGKPEAAAHLQSHVRVAVTSAAKICTSVHSSSGSRLILVVAPAGSQPLADARAPVVIHVRVAHGRSGTGTGTCAPSCGA